MAEMNLRQIADKLNEAFAGDTRKLVFWYDGSGEFREDVDRLELQNAKVLHLEPDNQFYTKYFLERVDTRTNYLIYAPFPRPALEDDHLADTIRYSREFFADKVSLAALNLGVRDDLRDVLRLYRKFFESAERVERLRALEAELTSRPAIEVALMSALLRLKTVSFEEVLRTVLTEDGFEDNRHFAELEKYGLAEAFWRMAEDEFGYMDAAPTLERLAITMFVTYTAKTVSCDIPLPWKPFLSLKSGNIIIFLDGLMNNVLYGRKYDEMAERVFAMVNGNKALAVMKAENLVGCGVFAYVDELILNWIVERLKAQDTGAKLAGKTVLELCALRTKTHFGDRRKSEYAVVENAWRLLAFGRYRPVRGLDDVADQYIREGWKADRFYRKFIHELDKIEDAERFREIAGLVENVYTNDFLNPLALNWSTEFAEGYDEPCKLEEQRRFYSKFIGAPKDKTVFPRTVVIISDALRYEVGRELYERLQEDSKCTASITALRSVLPSFTPLGMAALLPHQRLEFTDAYQVLVDGKTCDDLVHREAILRSSRPQSRCVQYDSIKGLSVESLREIFARQDVVYVYHNQIDARGDKPTTENEVFNACEEAIEEIVRLIRRLTTSANTTHFIVTADHGFIYKREKLTESDKIGNISGTGAFSGKRYVISKSAVNTEGVAYVPVSAILNNGDERVISFPMASNVFKAPGGGYNYVHGGCSPQEMLIPAIQVKTEKGAVATSNAQIALVTLTTKFTNLSTKLDFIQTEPISDIIKEASYRIFFITDSGEQISNENILEANSREKDTNKRMYRLGFKFKNRSYSRSQKYYLVAYDAGSHVEAFRHEVIIDLAFTDDYGF